MKVTIKQLKSFNACAEGLAWCKRQKNREVKHILRQCNKEGHFLWAAWYVACIFTKPQAVLYSIFAAERCLPAFEKEFPNDKRPRLAIEAARKWLNSQTEENKYAAWSAGYDAWYAASDAGPAAGYAGYAAWSAAGSATRYDAWSATRSAAWSAAEHTYRSAGSATRYDAWSALTEEAIRILGL